jgi:hypothetical protein
MMTLGRMALQVSKDGVIELFIVTTTITAVAIVNETILVLFHGHERGGRHAVQVFGERESSEVCNRQMPLAASNTRLGCRGLDSGLVPAAAAAVAAQLSSTGLSWLSRDAGEKSGKRGQCDPPSVREVVAVAADARDCPSVIVA